MVNLLLFIVLFLPQIRSSTKRSQLGQGLDYKSRPPYDMCVTRVMRAELPSALTAQRVCVEDSNPDTETLCSTHNEHATGCNHGNPTPHHNDQLEGHVHGNIDTGSCTSRGTAPPSNNHISKVTVNQVGTQETNQRAVWFLSTGQRHEFIPLNIQEEDLSSEQPDLSPVSTNQTLRNDHQPIRVPPDSHVTCSADQSKLELFIYEDNRQNGLNSDAEHAGNTAGKLNIQSGIQSKTQDSDFSSCTNQQSVLEEAGTSTQYILNNSVTNQSAVFMKPRVTMVSTSL